MGGVGGPQAAAPSVALITPTSEAAEDRRRWALPDHATGELVEARTYQPYGATESDYRPERWKGFREDYGFTGKEEDIEVGLQYFGKRYLSPYLGRWISPDPLVIHVPGKADPNLYAYVSGAVLKNVDPIGLDAMSGTWIEHAGATGQASYMQDTDTVNADVVEESADIVGMTIRGPGTVNGHVDGVTYNVPGPPKPESTEQVLRLPQHEGLRQLVGGSPEMGGALRLKMQYTEAMSRGLEASVDAGGLMLDIATLGASPTGDAVVAKRAFQLDPIGGGRLGGALFPESRIPRLESYLNRSGIELRVGDEFLPAGKAGGFSAEGQVLLLRSNPTRYEVQHELSHFIQWRKMGTEAYDAQSRAQKEQFVYDMLNNNENRWKALTEAQRNHANWYINDVGGIR